MIIAIPYVKGAADYDELARALVKHGLQQTHVLITLNSDIPEEMGEATNFARQINYLFDRNFSRNVACEKTGYGIANALVASAIRFAANYQPGPGEILQPPLLILDPSYVPTNDAWASQLQQEFFRNATSVVGLTEPIPDITVPVGRGSAVIPGGSIFVGPVMMRQDFGKTATMLPFLRAAEHWRATLRWDMLKNHAITQLVNPSDPNAVLTQQSPQAVTKETAKRQRRAPATAADSPAEASTTGEDTSDTPVSTPRNPFNRRG